MEFPTHIASHILQDWHQVSQRVLSTAQSRFINLHFSSSGAIALTGVRRSGKTSLALLKAQELSPENYLYVNFEDPLFIEYNHFIIFDKLIETYIEEKGIYPAIIVFDELQNISGWEKWTRKFIDSKKSRLIITGSSAKLLSGELATALAGRILEYTVWPLSYKEFRLFKNKDIPESALLSEFINFGAFPEVVNETRNDVKQKILQQYFSDILLKDVMVRNEIRDKKNLEKIIYHYFTNISCHHSYTALKKAYSLGGMTPQNYTQYLKDAFLLFEVERYHRNLKVQTRDSKKIYSIDVGLRNFNSKNLTEDRGKIIENIVFLELLRLNKKIFYYKGNLETDFILVENTKPISAIQVTDSDMLNEDLYKREVEGLLESLKLLHLQEGFLITKSRKENLKKDGFLIKMQPLGEWLRKEPS